MWNFLILVTALACVVGMKVQVGLCLWSWWENLRNLVLPAPQLCLDLFLTQRNWQRVQEISRSLPVLAQVCINCCCWLSLSQSLITVIRLLINKMYLVIVSALCHSDCWAITAACVPLEIVLLPPPKERGFCTRKAGPSTTTRSRSQSGFLATLWPTSCCCSYFLLLLSVL